jgi:hypothetical protein
MTWRASPTKALALLWGFLAVAVAVASSIALQSLDDDAQTCATTAHYAWRLLHVLARSYQHLASLSVWWFLASSLFELGWEMYAPFCL